jgi:hypothetical protein
LNPRDMIAAPDARYAIQTRAAAVMQHSRREGGIVQGWETGATVRGAAVRRVDAPKGLKQT